MAPVYLMHELRHLVIKEVESSLIGSRVYTKKLGGWSAKAKKEGIFFDLSKIEWIELNALVHIVLLIERALKEKISITVALPLPRPRNSEKTWMISNPSYAHTTQKRIDNRSKALDFLIKLRFEQAIKDDHLKKWLYNLQILYDYDSSAIFAGEHNFVEVFDEEKSQDIEFHYKFCYPLTWLTMKNPDTISLMADFIAGISSAKDSTHHGIEAIDAKTIANVILYELIDNVEKYAGNETRALVTARVRPESIPPDSKYLLDSYHPYINWLRQKYISMVEIIVGDSGIGIKNTLEESYERATPPEKIISRNLPNKTAKIMLWAFDRWSSGRKEEIHQNRGTRGLYRVDRIVKKYQGIVTLRSENQLVGFDHGGPAYDADIWYNHKLSYTPGTIVTLWLPPFQEETLSRKSTQEPLKKVKLNNFKIINLSPITNEGIIYEERIKLQDALSTERYVLAKIEGGLPTDEALKNALIQSIEIRHPGALVIIGLPGTPDQITRVINSINIEHEKYRHYVESHGPEHFEIWDPVLVIITLDRLELSLWVGTIPSRRKLLEALLSEDGYLSIEQVNTILPNEKERTLELLGIRVDTDLITINDDQALELNFELSTVPLVRKLLENHIELSRDGVKQDAIYRVPSLQLLGRWLNLKEILLQCTNGPELAFKALSILIKNYISSNKIASPDCIISESNSVTEHINLLQHRLAIDINKKYVLLGESGNPIQKHHIIDPRYRVLIYLDIILSDEPAERCLMQILRDHALPIAIACIFDGRNDYNKEIEVWGIKIPVIALARANMNPDYNSGKTIKYINPITKEIEAELIDFKKDDYKIKTKNLLKLIEIHKALHFSHVGRPIGRHFTFYLGSSGLINDPQIYEAFDYEIDKWKKEVEEDSMKLEIWHAEGEPQPTSAPARQFSEKISIRRKDIVHVRPIRREPAYGHWFFPEGQEVKLKSLNILIIDWGALTGFSVMQMIRFAAETGAKRIFVCIFLSQLPLGEESFLKLIHKLIVNRKIETFKSTSAGQLEISFEPDQFEHIEISASVRFLARFPIEVYENEHDCPVCQMSNILIEDYPTDFLANSSKQILDRFRTRTRDEIYDKETEDFLTCNDAIAMSNFRGKLVSALSSTRSREKIMDEIIRLHNIANEDNLFSLQEVLPYLTFLSVEKQWLNRPPLYSKDLRKLIAEIALKIAINNNLKIKDRLSAIIVLRAAFKRMFAENLHAVFASTPFSSQKDSAEFIGQLLYDAFTYIQRPYHQSKEIFQPMLENLNRIMKDVHQKKINLLTPEIEETIYSLQMHTQVNFDRAGIKHLTTAEAWGKLRKEFLDTCSSHRRIPTFARHLKPGPHGGAIDKAIKELEQSAPQIKTIKLHESVIGWLSRLGKFWTPCCNFLDRKVLLYLSKLTDVLQCGDSNITLDSTVVNELMDLIKNQPLGESRFSKIIKRISDNSYEIPIKEDWEYFKEKSKWFTECILGPWNPGDGSERPRLIDFILSAPVSVQDAVQEAYNSMAHELPDHKIDVKQIPEDALVFCTEPVFILTIHLLLGNIQKHWDKITTPINIVIAYEAERGIGRLSILNNGTELSDDPGKGHVNIRKEIRPFGARLDPEPRPKEFGMTYKCTITFIDGGIAT